MACGLKPSPQLRAYYRTLYRAWGPQHWWPARTAFEVIAGAYLTQNTAWSNVEKALHNLRRARMLSLAGVRRIPLSRLEELVRPAGYFRQKARRLKQFVVFVDRGYGGSLTRMFSRPTTELRQQLLELNGVGPETADSILLYAGNHPIFVGDAYTRRILHRHGMLPANAPYDEIRKLFESALRTENRQRRTGAHEFAHPPSPMSQSPRAPEAQVYNEMHGLMVNVGKRYCAKKAPRCEQCPLRSFLP